MYDFFYRASAILCIQSAIIILPIIVCQSVRLSVCKGKKEADLYSAFIEVPYTQGAQPQVAYGSHSVTCKLHRTCLYLVSIHQMAHPRLRLRTSNCTLLLIYLPRKDERLSWPGWLVTQWDSLPARKQSPIPVLTGLDVGQLRWSRPTRYRYTKPPILHFIISYYLFSLLLITEF